MLASRSDIFMRRLGAVDETWLVDPETCMSKRDSDGSANRQREHMAKPPEFPAEILNSFSCRAFSTCKSLECYMRSGRSYAWRWVKR